MAATGILELTPEDARVARVLLGMLDDLERRQSGRGSSVLHFSLVDLKSRLLHERVFEDPTRLLLRLKRKGLLEERPEGRTDRGYRVLAVEDLRLRLTSEVARLETPGPVAVHPVPDEFAELRAMDRAFLEAVRDVVTHRLDATIAFGRSLTVERLADYLRELFGETLFFDSLIALLQQYALADVPLLAPTGRATGSTGFHLAFFGPPGTGKTFAIDDMVRGNPRTGVPAHGLPGRNRYCGGITPVQFLRVGAAYEGRTFNFIVPEFNDWFKYKGMVEPLKLVMEQREVKWETTLGTVGPYTFRSFFSANYNVRTEGADNYWTTIADPNFAALEDRMLLRFHPMTRDRFRAVEASSERLELGELTFDLAGPLRDHVTLVHAIQTRHPLVAHQFPAKPVRLNPAIYADLRGVSDAALARTPHPKFSPRLKSRAIRLAAAAAMVRYFGHEEDFTLGISPAETVWARRFYEEEIRAREGRRGPTS